jgi:hypothetical protein
MIRTEYLNEAAVADFGKIRIDSGAACNKNFLDSRCRPDFASHVSRVVLEFDGYGHYTSAKTIIRDTERCDIYSEWILGDSHPILRSVRCRCC